MTDSTARRYQVVYSDLVQDEFEALLRSAGGRALDLLLAFRKADYILVNYPQFGEPDVIDEANSAVYVTVPILDRPDPDSQ